MCEIVILHKERINFLMLLWRGGERGELLMHSRGGKKLEGAGGNQNNVRTIMETLVV